MRLDDLARAARDELAASVDALDVPPPASPRARRSLAVLSFAALVVIAVTAATVLTGRDDGASKVVATGPTTARYFVLDDPTGALRPAAVLPISEADESASMRFAYFGDAGRDDPFVASDALVMVAPVASNISFDDRGDPITVRGGTGRFRADDQAAGFRVNLLGFTAGDQLVSIVSRHLDQAAMIAFANALTVDATTIKLAQPVARLERIGAPTSGPPTTGPAIGSTQAVTYSASAGAVTLSVGRGDRDSLRTLRWWNAEPTELDGHPAMRITAAGTGTNGLAGGLVWLLEDGTLLSLSGTGNTFDLRALAAQVREIDAAAWDQLRSTVNTNRPALPTGPSGSSTPTAQSPILNTFTGREGDATWTLDDRGGSQCLTVTLATLRATACASGVLPAAGSSGIQTLSGLPATPLQGRVYFAFPTDRDVTHLTLTRAGGERINLTLIGAATDGRALFLGSFPLATDTSTAGRDRIEVTVTYTHRDGTTTSESALMPLLALPTSTTR